jgi:2-polyprenyl-3-methyl-5-hydroxy-6-metoxy-1,4-benzoquinol methylase
MIKHHTIKPNLIYKNIPIYADSEEPRQIIFEQIFFWPNDGNILDLGAGVGALSQRIIDAGYQITAADLHEETFIAMADFVTSDLNKDFTNHFEGKNYDCIFAT